MIKDLAGRTECHIIHIARALVRTSLDGKGFYVEDQETLLETLRTAVTISL